MPVPTLKYGKRDPKNAPSLKFAKYRATAVPTFPPVDYLKPISWAGTMNGNDSFGDCVACGILNLTLAASSILTGTPIRGTEAEAVAIYKTQNKNFDPNGSSDTNGPDSSADGGMDEQTALEYWQKTGFIIGGQLIKIVGFLKVDQTNLAELKAAISVGGANLLGVQMSAAQQTQFPGVWDYVASSPIEGGHCIIGGGHEDIALDDVKAACWASEFGTTDLFLAHQLDEAWLVIFEWNLNTREFIEGMDVATFATDLTAITGQPFPVPVPAPQPVPAPSPVPPTPAPPVTPPTPVPTVDPYTAAMLAAGDTWEKTIFSRLTKAAKFKATFDAWKSENNYS